MRSEHDVIVVGVGGMGSATVAHLAERGVDVLGIERFDVPNAKGSSHGVTRIIRLPQYEDPSYVPLVRRSLELWTELDERHARRLFHRTGTLDLGSPGSDVVAGSAESCAVHDIPHDRLSGSEVNERFPGYDLPANYRAVYQPDGGFLHAEQCIVAHTDAAHEAGATVRARERVESWDAGESGVSVSTDRGEYAAETLVVTAGAWTGTLLPAFDDHLEPERQVLGWFQPERPERFAPDRFPAFVADVPSGHYYGVPVYEVPGVKVGKFHHRGETGAPADLRREPTREDERLLREFAETYAPSGAGPTMRLSTCMFTNTPDGDFVLDAHPDHPNVVVGEVLADLATRGATDHPVDAFRVARFD